MQAIIGDRGLQKKYDLVAESHCCRDKITNFDARLVDPNRNYTEK